MKRRTAILLALALALAGAGLALAENADNTVKCAIEDGSYVIRMSGAETAEGWKADAAAEGGAARELPQAAVEDGTLVVRYEPAEEGAVTLRLRHFEGAACDQLYTWDLIVKDGAVTESVGGSYTASPAAEELDAVLGGDWLEADTQFTCLTLTSNDAGGWDAEIVSPVTHGAYVLQASLAYDCERDALVYADGRLYDVPITDSEESELGEPVSVDAAGSLTLEPFGEDGVALRWVSGAAPEETVLFVRDDAQ